MLRVQWKVDLRLALADKAAIVEEYRRGTPTTALCDQHHVTKTTVLKILGDAGVRMRRQPMTTEYVTEACGLFRAGLSLRQVADRLDARVGTVRDALLQGDVTLRPATGARTSEKRG